MAAPTTSSRLQQVVSHYKDHPAVLMWMLRGEWNINLYFGNGANTPLQAAQCTQAAALMVKGLDSNHPVATSYGDIDINDAGRRLADTRIYVNDVATAVDIWSLNIFRGETFGTLFDQWRSITTKPMFIGEFGTDVMNNPASLPDETMQAGWDVCLWNDAIKELSAVNPALVNMGGLVFEWNEEWWKVFPPGVQDSGGYVGGPPRRALPTRTGLGSQASIALRAMLRPLWARRFRPRTTDLRAASCLEWLLGVPWPSNISTSMASPVSTTAVARSTKIRAVVAGAAASTPLFSTQARARRSKRLKTSTPLPPGRHAWRTTRVLRCTGS